jgi:phage terminase small subunit
MVLEKPRHEIFCEYVARGKSQAEAYMIAGYKRSDGNAATLAKRPEIRARIEEIKGEAAAAAQVSVGRVVTELARIAFADVTEAVQVIDGKVVVADSDTWSPNLRAAVSEIIQNERGDVRIKLHSKGAALESLAKHLSMYRDQAEVDVNISLADLVNGSYELEKRLRAEGKLIDVAPVKTPDDSP